ncbi:BTAD domain-containing putative transcriptional regulator [Kitasatospora sp. NPDC089797]|uniref:AfsR/SARP family transcriptional regulator n=1 Tax=Kitasatospora sp. NPDC089797 TaxID=3155298 RepID=UPI003436C850
MRVRLLGRVELRCEQGRPVALAGARRRAVLALLASELNGHVPVERLLDTVWEGAPPPTARAALQGHVSAVRRSLGEGLALVTRAQGYVLVGAPETVDAKRFEQLAAAAEETADADRAAALLREALDLWDGPALTDSGSATLTATTGRRLDTARAHAVERLAERLLTLGRGTEALDDLRTAVSADPLREPTAALLVRCLRQAGREADARAAQERAQARLAAHGLTPGQLLRRAGQAADPPGAADGTADGVRVGAGAGAGFGFGAGSGPGARAERAAGPGDALPRPGTALVGRAAELRRLDEAACRADGRPVLVTGVAGAGKSSLVLHWAHARGERFPDGRIHLDLRGFGEEDPLTATAALALLLTRLGVPAAEVPEDQVRAGALLRRLTEGRQLLLVLDGARSAEQVEPLLPGAPEPVVVITSRSRLTDLVVHEAAIPLPVGGLSEGEAVELLGRIAGPGRIAAEPAAARRLAALCDRLPLALRVAGARLASRPAWSLGDLVDEMSDRSTGLSALATGGTLGIAAALGRTVSALPEEARRLFTLSGLHPGGTLDGAAAAALADVPRARARELLAELDAAHLVQESSPGRFRGDRLAGLYAAELAAELPDQDRAEATRRLLDHAVDAATAALERLTAAVPARCVSARAFETAEQALELARGLVTGLARQVTERADPGRPGPAGGPEGLLDRLSRTLAEACRGPAGGDGGDGGAGPARGHAHDDDAPHDDAPHGAGPREGSEHGGPGHDGPECGEADLMDRLLADLLRGIPVVRWADPPGGARAVDARVPRPRLPGPRAEEAASPGG